MAADPNGRVACETSVTTGLVLVFGEISTTAHLDVPKIARETIKGIGYDNPAYGFDGDSCSVLVAIDEQSPDIAAGVGTALEVRGHKDADRQTGAGDQGMMIGYAVDETPELMPLPIALAHNITRRLADCRRQGLIGYLRPDSKSQVTVEYGYDHRPIRVDTIVISTQHDDDVTQEQIAEDLERLVIREVVPDELLDDNVKTYINPSGRFVVGGPVGDSGLTGRKIIVDTYGEAPGTAAAHFRARTPPKSTARAPTPPVMWRRTSSQPDLPNAPRSRSPTPSASPTPSQ